MIVNDLRTSLLFSNKICYNNQNELNTIMERISTGSRLARVMDDPSGLAISKGFESMIRGQNVAIQNVEDGISVCRLQSAALQEVSEILLRMRDIALRASNDAIMTTADYQIFTNEYNTLKNELDRFHETAEYNTIPILKGEPRLVASSDLEFMFEWHTPDTDIDMHVIQPDGEHAWYADKDPNGHGEIDVDDVDGITGGDPAVEHYNVATGAALTGNYDLWINYYGENAGHPPPPLPDVTVTVTISKYRGTEFEEIQSFDVVVPYQHSNDPWAYGGPPYGEVFVGSYYWEPLPEYTDMELHVGPQDGDYFHYEFMYPNTSVGALALKGSEVADGDFCRAAVTKLDESLKRVSDHMALVGIRQSTLQHIIGDMSTGNINMAAANSRITNADLAVELTNLAKAQLMSQTATEARAMYSSSLFQQATAIVGLIE
ncbi:MAG: flagellin [bacterium]